MSSIKLGLVVEGPTDCIVFEKLIPAYLRDNAFEKVTLVLRNLQPFVDNTSKSGYSEGGWEQVYKWCVGNPAEHRRNLYLSMPLFADEMDENYCDALLIHLDSDICENIGDKCNIVPVPKVGDAAEVRGEFISNVLRKWLWTDDDSDESGHILVPVVESIEAWLVAGLSEIDVDAESHPDIQRRLAEINYERYRRRAAPHDMKKLSKSLHEYRRMATDAATAVHRIIEKCPHFSKMIQQVVDVVSAKSQMAA